MRSIIREGLRNLVCACFAYALVLQLIFGALGAAAHASAPSSDPGGRNVICSTTGSTSTPSAPADADHHQLTGDCCMLSCVAPANSLMPPKQALWVVLSLKDSGVRHVTTGGDAAIREPPVRSAPQSPRAPPFMS